MKYCFLLLMLSVTAMTAAEEGRYIRVGVGAALTENTEANFLFVGDRGLDLDPGLHLSVAGGMMFGDFFGLELETGFIYNEISSISGFENADGYVAQVPFLANAVLQLRNRTPLTPFMGAGAGGAISTVDLDTNSGGFELEGTDSELVFAWQVFGGLKYRVGERLDLGVVYKYFATDDGTQSHLISATLSFGF